MGESHSFANALVEHTDEHVRVGFTRTCPVLSSAVMNGGAVEADHILNLKVPKRGETAELPESTLQSYTSRNGWQGLCVGMMTAASMASLRIKSETVDGVEIAVLVTAGLSNPRRAGDRADHRSMETGPQDPGTINTIVLSSAPLTDAAMVEAIMLSTEAKVAALQECSVLSPVSNAPATGTGTDSCAVACNPDGQGVRYVGKHVLFGEILGKLVKQAVAESVEWYLSQ